MENLLDRKVILNKIRPNYCNNIMLLCKCSISILCFFILCVINKCPSNNSKCLNNKPSTKNPTLIKDQTIINPVLRDIGLIITISGGSLMTLLTNLINTDHIITLVNLPIKIKKIIKRGKRKAIDIKDFSNIISIMKREHKSTNNILRKIVNKAKINKKSRNNISTSSLRREITIGARIVITYSNRES